MSSTLEYYQDNAQEFFDATVNADVSANYDHFLKFIPEHGKILDFGCGSGRDTRAFMLKGYSVEAIDGSIELCRLATKYCGIQVQCMDFMNLNETNKYDGIWACATLLHISKEHMPSLLAKMKDAIVEGGVIYISFKLGDFEGERNGRFFLDVTPKTFRDILGHVTDLNILEEWVSVDVRQDNNTKWYNILLNKNC